MKELQRPKQDLIATEVVLFAQRRRSAAHRLLISESDSSTWLNTFEFLHFQRFHKRQVIMIVVVW